VTDAEKAYAAAERRIAKAKESGADNVHFVVPACHALTRIPPQIADLPALRAIDFDYTQISDLTPLARLTARTRLSLNSTPVTDLAPLAYLTSLKQLLLNSTKVSDLSPLAGMTSLTQLLLSDTPVSNLAPLADLKALRLLWLSATSVTDIAPLANLTALKELSLTNTPVTNLALLTAQTKSRQLLPVTNPLSDIPPRSAGLPLLSWLWLDNTQVDDLAPLSVLRSLTRLCLNNTPVTNLTPLADLTELCELGLGHTAVLDLRPLRSINGLVDAPMDDGLSLIETSASRADPRIAEIAEIEDPAERARTLFDYLKDWVPPGSSERPQPDPLLSVVMEDGRLEVPASQPTEAERDERLKQVLHARMREKARDLAAAAGNRFPRLAARARAVAEQVDRSFEDLDLTLLHLEVEDLSARADAGVEDGDPYPPEVTGPLGDVLRAGPGLTLGHPEVDLLVERTDRARGRPLPAEAEANHDAMTAVVATGEAAFGDRLRALEAQVQTLPAATAQAVQEAAHRNILWKIAVGASVEVPVRLAGGAVFYVGSQFLGPPVTEFVLANWSILVDVAATYGSAFSTWFVTSLAAVQEFAPLAKATLDQLRADLRAESKAAP
jgi:hypothetical protein